MTHLPSSESHVDRAQPYYATGEHLRGKHELIRHRSGRTIEEWALQLVAPAPTARILDAGCGWGRYAWPLLEVYGVAAANLVCADISLGMVQSAMRAGEERGHHPHFVNCGIEALPFPAQHFDGAMANFVLYHVDPLDQGVRELARILKPQGWLLVAAHGVIKVLVIELHVQALDQLGIPYVREATEPFNLESGAAILRERFGRVDPHDFVDEQIYPSAEAFMQSYLTTGRYRNLMARDDIPEEKKAALPHLFYELAAQVADDQGAIHAPVSMGALICTEPRQSV